MGNGLESFLYGVCAAALCTATAVLAAVIKRKCKKYLKNMCAASERRNGELK